MGGSSEHRSSGWAQRIGAALRPRGRIEGFVDGLVGGEIRGWALDPDAPGRRVHVVATCDGQVVAEALADTLRQDLLADGRGDGRHGFRLRLPPELLDGSPRMLCVEGMLASGRERLLRGEIATTTTSSPSGAEPAPDAGAEAPAEAGIEPAAAPPPRAALVIWGEDAGAFAQTADGWRAEDGIELSALRADEDEGVLRAALAGAHTVLFAKAGDSVDPQAARLLVQIRPLADVLTWSGLPEGQALGVLLGQGLGGAFAVRGHALAAYPGALGEALRSPGLRRLELWLASRPELRWTRLPGALTSREGATESWKAFASADSDGLDGLAWRGSEGVRPARLVPSRRAARISLAAWPAGSEAAHDSLLALLAGAVEAQIELLTTPEGVERLEARIGSAGAGLRERVAIRPVDPPAGGGEGAWLAALSGAAMGEVVALVEAGVEMSAASGALEELAAWSLFSGVGAVTAALRSGERVAAGLGVCADPAGWRCGLAAEIGGRSRPVLAAPAQLLVISRARLAAVGGVDDVRFPGLGADLDLGLRLRRAGWTNLALAGLAARMPATAAAAPLEGAQMAAFDGAELAVAAWAYPEAASP